MRYAKTALLLLFSICLNTSVFVFYSYANYDSNIIVQKKKIEPPSSCKAELFDRIYTDTEYIKNVSCIPKPPTKRKPKPKLHKILVYVCSCESTGNPYKQPIQFENGSVLRGKIDNNDIGMCQINERYWGNLAKKLGFDIHTKEGNIRMANYIYENNGLQPWSASKGCWGSFVK